MEEQKKDLAEIDAATKWVKDVKTARDHWEKKRFKKMREDQQFVRGKQWPQATDDDDRYVANITKRKINQAVSAIYARNPTFVAKRRRRLEYPTWDGDQMSLQAAMERMALGTPMPGDVELLEEVNAVERQNRMLDRIAKTLEVVFKHQLDEPIPRFKTRFKQAVRRCKTTGVAYVKLGYQRFLEHKPEILERIHDDSARISELEAMAQKAAKDGTVFAEEAELERLRAGLVQLQNEKKIVAKEGLVFSFPRSTKIIPSLETEHINGFIGSRWVAEEHDFRVSEVEKFFGVDLSKCAYTHYKRAPSGDVESGDGGSGDEPMARAWEIYDLEMRTCLWVLDGYDGYLRPPGPPDIWTEQFHPYFPLVINDIDDESDPFPDSDVHDLRPMQLELNRSREGLRDHRKANRPAWLGAKGLLKPDEAGKLSAHSVGEYIELENFSPSDELDLEKKIKPKPVQPIDPALYDAAPVMQDALLVSGDQQANLGPTSGATATESAIAENSRSSGLSSETDELDDFLTMLARACGQLLLLEMSAETVKRIAGPGAVWPEFSRQEVADEIYLEILAGSSGRPNRQLRINAIERTGNILVQVPGIRPTKLAQEMVQGIDESADINDWIDPAMPSITALNGMTQPAPADPGDAPDAQGQEGANKQPRPGGRPGPSQRVFPSSAEAGG